MSAQAARAIDALRRGWPITVRAVDGALDLLPIETADPGRLAGFDPAGVAPIPPSSGRAATLRLARIAGVHPGLFVHPGLSRGC